MFWYLEAAVSDKFRLWPKDLVMGDFEAGGVAPGACVWGPSLKSDDLLWRLLVSSFGAPGPSQWWNWYCTCWGILTLNTDVVGCCEPKDELAE